MEIKDPFGNIKDYDPKKIIDSVMRAGFSRSMAEEIEGRIRERVAGRIKSKELYRIVYEEMRKVDTSYALRYRLREAIGQLNPQYHEFERYMTAVLQMEGFETEHSPRPLPQGQCSEHEVDIVARDGQMTYAVECKHHFHYHRITGMDVAMIQYATLDDLHEGAKAGVRNALDVDGGWVIVNTKLSEHAKQYAGCKDIRMTAWDCPEGDSLREIVERHRAYPITIAPMPTELRVALSKQDMLTLQDLVHLRPEEAAGLGVSQDVLTDTQETARALLQTE